MPRAIEKWFDFLKDRPIPALASVATRIQQLLNRPNTSHQEMASALMFAPGMSIELFRVIRRLPHPPKVPIQGLSHAVAMVGMEPLQQAALRTPSIDRTPREAQPGLRLCYSRAIQSSYFAEGWARIMRLPHPDEIALAALVDECAEMGLWANAPQQMLAINALRDTGSTTDDAAIQVLGASLRDLSLALAEYWALPPLAIESLGHNVYTPRPLCVVLACAFARTIDTSWVNVKSDMLLELIHEYLDLSPDQTLAMVHQQAAEIARAAHFTGLPMTIHHLPMIPEERKKTMQAPEPAIAKRQGALDTGGLKQAGGLELKRAAGIRPLQEDPFLKGVNQLLQFLHRQVGLPRCLFARLDGASGRIAQRQIAGINPGPLQGFNYPASNRLLGLLLKKSASLWLNAENRPKYQPLLPSAGEGGWSEGDCFLSSLSLGEQPIGLIYADANGAGLNNQQYLAFKAAVNRFSAALSKAHQKTMSPQPS